MASFKEVLARLTIPEPPQEAKPDNTVCACGKIMEPRLVKGLMQWYWRTDKTCDECIQREYKEQQKQKIRESIEKKIPPLYRAFEWEHFIVEGSGFFLLLSLIEESKNDTLGSCYIYGDVGRGKTMLACIIVKNLIRYHRDAILINFSEWLDEMRTNIEKPGAEKITDIVTLKNCEYLIIDDLGAERMSEWVNEKLYNILNHRYENAKPVIITSNLSPEDMSKKIWERTMSRIHVMCNRGKRFIPMNGQNRRN